MLVCTVEGCLCHYTALYVSKFGYGMLLRHLQVMVIDLITKQRRILCKPHCILQHTQYQQPLTPTIQRQQNSLCLLGINYTTSKQPLQKQISVSVWEWTFCTAALFVSQEKKHGKLKCCLSLIVYKTRRVENTHQPKKVEARSVLLQDSLLGDKAVNADIQCRVPAAELDCFRTNGRHKDNLPWEGTGKLLHISSPFHAEWYWVWVPRFMARGRSAFQDEGRGKLRHHSLQTADSMPQMVNGSLSAAAGGTGCLQRSPTRDGHFYTKQYPALERSERGGTGAQVPAQKERPQCTTSLLRDDRRVPRHPPDLPLPHIPTYTM